MLKKLTALCVLAAFSLPVSTVIAQTSTSTSAPASAVQSAEPAVATPPAAPAPVVAPVTPTAPPAPPKRCDFAVTLQSDEIFEHHKSALNSKGKQLIDTEVMGKLANCAKIDLIIVSGHTDLIGSHPQTQKLSEKHADAVVAYLTSKGINAPMDTMGMGKTQQIKACDDKLAKAKLAECLAPNRRVVIEGRGMAK